MSLKTSEMAHEIEDFPTHLQLHMAGKRPLLGSPGSQPSARETAGSSLPGFSPGLQPRVDQGSKEIPELSPSEKNTLWVLKR